MQHWTTAEVHTQTRAMRLMARRCPRFLQPATGQQGSSAPRRCCLQVVPQPVTPARCQRLQLILHLRRQSTLPARHRCLLVPRHCLLVLLNLLWQQTSSAAQRPDQGQVLLQLLLHRCWR